MLVRDGEGRHVHRYHGEVVDVLREDQAKYLPDRGMVEEFTPAQVVAVADAQERRQRQADDAEAERVRACIDVLEELEVPIELGRPTVRARLEARGHRFSNETLAAAINTRRELSRTPEMPAWPGVQEMAAPVPHSGLD